MIESISPSSVVETSYSSGSANSNKLSVSDYEAISSILSQYDGSNLSESDAQSITESFKEAGIAPTRQLVNAMDSLGFSAQEVGELAGVQGIGLVPPPPPPPAGANPLSDFQLETISSILSQYDTDNITQSEAEDIDSALKAAGIQPSAELASAMEVIGFDAREIGDLAEVYRRDNGFGMPPPPLPNQEQEENEISSLLDTLFTTDNGSEDSDTPISDNIMEYTSRILNLNNESKAEVMSMLAEFSSEDSTYSMEGIRSSLSSILGNSNNYNRISVYA